MEKKSWCLSYFWGYYSPFSNSLESLQKNMNSVTCAMKKIKNVHYCIAMIPRIDFELGFHNSRPWRKQSEKKPPIGGFFGCKGDLLLLLPSWLRIAKSQLKINSLSHCNAIMDVFKFFHRTSDRVQVLLQRFRWIRKRRITTSKIYQASQIFFSWIHDVTA